MPCARAPAGPRGAAGHRVGRRGDAVVAAVPCVRRVMSRIVTRCSSCPADVPVVADPRARALHPGRATPVVRARVGVGGVRRPRRGGAQGPGQAAGADGARRPRRRGVVRRQPPLRRRVGGAPGRRRRAHGHRRAAGSPRSRSRHGDHEHPRRRVPGAGCGARVPVSGVGRGGRIYRRVGFVDVGTACILELDD